MARKELRTYTFHVYHLTEKFNLREIADFFSVNPYKTKPDEIIFKYKEDSFLIVFNLGSMVFFNVDSYIRESEITTVKSHLQIKDDIITSDEFTLEINPDKKIEVSYENVILDKISLDRIQLISLILGMSSALEYFELSVEKILEKSNLITENLEKGGKFKHKNKEIIKFIGHCLTIRQRIISLLYLLDKPDVTWNDASLDNLYQELFSMFELKERFKAIEYKIKLIQEVDEILAELVRSKKETILELTIIFLILFEVILFVYEVFK